MKPEKVFKRYDIRGDYPGEVNEEFAERLGKALGTFATRNYSAKVVVGRDNKESSEPLKEAFIKGLKETGAKVLDAGTGPTDFVTLAGRENGSVSVQVTSSHLPLNTNGFKFMYPEGNGFLNEDLHQVQDLFREKDFETGEGTVSDISEESRKEYFEQVKNFFQQFFDSVDRTVVVDTLGGAATGFLPELMQELGAEVIDVASEKNAEAPYLDPPNPDPENLGYVEERVEEAGADLAVVTDMDADRVAVYCNGRWLTGDELFAVLVRMMRPDQVVASIDTSKTVEETVADVDGEISYTRVGDPFVISRAIEENAPLAGEPNNHYCFTDFVPYNSGILSALLFSAMDLGEALETVPGHEIRHTAVSLESNGVKEEKMGEIRAEVRDRYEIVSEMDGIKYIAGKAVVLIRPSSRSPIIRVVVESADKEVTEQVLEETTELVRNP